MGEGAGVVILEELEHALKRGARIYGEVVGYRASGDAYHLTGQLPEHEGLQRAMRGALADAGMSPDEVDYVNAHGTSTPLNDSNEAKAIAKVFGDAAGEAQRLLHEVDDRAHARRRRRGGVHRIAAGDPRPGRAAHDQLLQRRIPACGELDFTPNQAKQREVRAALSNSAGFGGHNVSLVVKRFQE